MMIGLELLKWIRAQVAWSWSFRPSTSATTFVPTRAKLAASPALDATFLSYCSEVLARFADLETRGLISKLNNARSQATAMGSPPARQPISGLPGNTVGRFDDRLLLEVSTGSASTTIGYGLASGATDPASITDKVTAIIQLRRVEDILIRVLAAERAATATAQLLPAIMALYRVEGNLGVPPSVSTLDRLIPSDVRSEATSIVSFPADSSGARFWPQLVWLAKKTGIYGTFSFEYPPISPLTEFEVKEPAVLDWGLQICGLDVLQARFFGRPSGLTMTEDFAVWSNDNWTKAGLASDIPAGRQRWRDIVNELEIRDVSVGEGCISITPKDPVAFVGRLLAEAQALLLAGNSLLGPGTALDLPMRYFVYHAGVKQAKRIFTRSLLEIHATSPAAFPSLLAEIRSDAAYTSKLEGLKPMRSVSDQTVVEAALEGVSADTVTWLGAKSPTRLSLLTDFLETATGSDWSTWTEHRGNLSRYMVLLDYYDRLFV